MRPRLENWMRYGGRLYGVVFGHPKIADGTHLMTTPVIAWSDQNRIACTRTGVTYDLGQNAVTQ
jgi:hypothetical protein